MHLEDAGILARTASVVVVGRDLLGARKRDLIQPVKMRADGQIGFFKLHSAADRIGTLNQVHPAKAVVAQIPGSADHCQAFGDLVPERISVEHFPHQGLERTGADARQNQGNALELPEVVAPVVVHTRSLAGEDSMDSLKQLLAILSGANNQIVLQKRLGDTGVWSHFECLELICSLGLRGQTRSPFALIER